MYIKTSYTDIIFKRIYKSKLRRRKGYRYSDLGFYLFYKAIENVTHMPFDEYVVNKFYKSLGATTLRFNPLEEFEKAKIVPTENDTRYRKQLLQGYVHDYGAAMMGGISGHAGLLSNANDLAKLMQMYLQYGSYAGKRYIKKETIELFSSCQYCSLRNRRGLGFDRPKRRGGGNPSKFASSKSYGHTGFTGNIVWIDPEHNFVYIFLSNRINPSIRNRKLQKLNIRSRIHSVFYRAIKDSKKQK